MNPPQSIVLLPTTSIQNVTNSYQLVDNSSSSTSSNTFSTSLSNSNKINTSLIILSSANTTPASISSLTNATALNQRANQKSNNNSGHVAKRQQPIKPKLTTRIESPISNTDSTSNRNSAAKLISKTLVSDNSTEIALETPIKVVRKRAASSKSRNQSKLHKTDAEKSKNNDSKQSHELQLQLDEEKPTKSVRTRKIFKRTKRSEQAAENLAFALDPKITSLIKSISSNTADKSAYKEADSFFSLSRTKISRQRIASLLPASAKTHYSQSLFG